MGFILSTVKLGFSMYDLFLEERLECFIVLKHDVVAEQVKVLERFGTLHLTMVL